jgi:hypothetical protein
MTPQQIDLISQILSYWTFISIPVVIGLVINLFLRK